MKFFLSITALTLGLLPFAGCSSTTDTAGENGNRFVRTFDTNGKEMVDDTDNLLLVDHPSYLSKRPIPNE